jgi:probable H4MPT-linked C1 transfer pathway protein
MSLSVLGLDIGGANLKAAWYNPVGRLASATLSRPFALWKNPAGLAGQLAELAASFPAPDLTAVTMTGELCDCFESKRQGVEVILDAVEAACLLPVYLWTNRGEFVDLPAARADLLPLASANWLALATFAARFAAPDGLAVVIDVGSTTTDIIPLQDGRPVPCSRTDPERLRSGELVYTGVRRTPVCALLGSAVTAELFATSLDAYVVLGWLAEDPADCNTADGKPATRPAAERRLARMLGADLETSTAGERHGLAQVIVDMQGRLITAALRRVVVRQRDLPSRIILAGEGEFLARLAVDRAGLSAASKLVSVGSELGAGLSRAACAYAVAVLAAWQEDGSKSS